MAKKAVTEKGKNLLGAIENLGFKYERKRLKREKKFPPLCPDYEPDSNGENCKKAALCKNATYGWEGIEMGSCYGGTKEREREKKREIVLRNIPV